MIADADMGRRNTRLLDLPRCVYERTLSRFADTEGERLDASPEAPWFGDDL